MGSVANFLRRETYRDISRLPASERVALALELGEQAVTIFAAALRGRAPGGHGAVHRRPRRALSPGRRARSGTNGDLSGLVPAGAGTGSRRGVQLHGDSPRGRDPGFETTLRDGDTAVGYYMGFDYPTNERVPVCLRLLQACVEEGIHFGCTRLSLGRTALEPKSRVGGSRCAPSSGCVTACRS
jgi:hypothetical protein